ncbi:hypothetical protein LTR56_002648 [Elasticomyces elasticus]|nr:hypothetical protein LTR22_021652 [Elasticomyces elasticus]KAK3657132.1 hypothetical protein LTR56_002648 [Elasticomyces elasticus]KAK4905517.1 hypothetical protein LTR49_025190 [Elasticomyces elasticus]KAK5742777.1 hypothetical protein LTS12_024098 [Elasticomyces elasticus]
MSSSEEEPQTRSGRLHLLTKETPTNTTIPRGALRHQGAEVHHAFRDKKVPYGGVKDLLAEKGQGVDGEQKAWREVR